MGRMADGEYLVPRIFTHPSIMISDRIKVSLNQAQGSSSANKHFIRPYSGRPYANCCRILDRF